MLNAETVKARALELGFDACGISAPRPQTLQHYRDWLANGLHGEMAYMAHREPQRSDPSLLLEGVQSVIVVAKRYLTVEMNQTEQGAQSGIVSRYAWGEDYHDVLRPRIRQLCVWIESESGGAHRARGFIDSGPALERDYAAQAGIGWFGKHANILSRSLGNWFFLGVALTTAPLDRDAPVSGHCGTCTRCLDSCPTNAFVSPYVLDARRCISYLTIELKGPIPRELRPLMGTRIFGCDDCLEVCPWNRFAQPVDEREFMPREGMSPADLVELLQLTNAEFRERFKGTPVLRTKRRGLLRNVCIALGNCSDVSVAPALIEALNDDEPLVRGHAAWALGELNANIAVDALQTRQRVETDEFALEEIAAVLKRLS